jgi:hypothetical protein
MLKIGDSAAILASLVVNRMENRADNAENPRHAHHRLSRGHARAWNGGRAVGRHGDVGARSGLDE